MKYQTTNNYSPAPSKEKKFRYKKTIFGIPIEEARKMTMDELIEVQENYESRGTQVKHGYREGYEEAIKLLKERVPVVEVAKKTGKSISTINKWRRETDIPKLTPEERRKRMAEGRKKADERYQKKWEEEHGEKWAEDSKNWWSEL